MRFAARRLDRRHPDPANRQLVLVRNPHYPLSSPRLERVAKHSLFGAFFGSGLGVLILLLLYAANVYAAYEIAIFRARPVPLVCGVAAVLPVAGPLLFLALAVVGQATLWMAVAADMGASLVVIANGLRAMATPAPRS